VLELFGAVADVFGDVGDFAAGPAEPAVCAEAATTPIRMMALAAIVDYEKRDNGRLN